MLSAGKLGWDKLRLVDYEMKFNQFASAVQIFRDAAAECKRRVRNICTWFRLIFETVIKRGLIQLIPNLERFNYQKFASRVG